MLFSGLSYEFEKTFIMAGLEKAEGNRTKAAKMIGLHRNTFRNKFLSHGLSASQINSKRNKNRLTH